MWDLIVSVPDHCLSFYLRELNDHLSGKELFVRLTASEFMYLVISLLLLWAVCGIWLCQFLIIAYLFTLPVKQCKHNKISLRLLAANAPVKARCLLQRRCSTERVCPSTVPQTIRDLNAFPDFFPLLKAQKVVLLSSPLWWDLGTNSPGSLSWCMVKLSFGLVTSKMHWPTFFVECKTSALCR